MAFDYLKNFCTENPAPTYWLAYSGGLDSHVLLSLMATLREQLPIHIRAIHINHNLSPNAKKWASHCAAICADLNIELSTQEITINTNNGESIEEAARDLRYQIFAEHMQAGDILLTAHQQDDQAETFLLQLLRGAGVKGLSAMPMLKPFSQGKHARPLLNFSRVYLLEYAQKHQLHWIEDESNQNKKFLRNFIRQEFLPLLLKREPAAIELLSRSASHCAEAQSLLDEYVQQDLLNCAGSRENTLSIKQLLLLSLPRQKLVLRTWIHAQGFRTPDHRRLASIMHDVFNAAWDRMPCVRWDGAELRRYGDDLFIMPELIAMELPKPIAIDNERFVFKYRAGSEMVRIPGRGSQSLKNLFQEWRVPPWERDKIPLLYAGEEIIAVSGYYLHPDFAYLQPLL